MREQCEIRTLAVLNAQVTGPLNLGRKPRWMGIVFDDVTCCGLRPCVFGRTGKRLEKGRKMKESLYLRGGVADEGQTI